MRVLHVIPSLSPAMGGPPQVAINLVRTLRQIGIDAEIIATNDDAGKLLDVPLQQRTEYEQVPVWFFPRFPLRMKEYLFSAEMAAWLQRHIKDYDILDNHYLFSYAPSCAAALARKHGVPYTIRIMGQLTEWALAQSRLKKQIYTTLIERRNLNQASAIHCTSTSEAEDAANFGIAPPKIVLPLGVNPSPHVVDAKAKLRRYYNISEHTPIILFLSRLHYKKRPNLLLQALSQLSPTDEFHLILAGSGESAYVMELKELANCLGISDRVHFTGFVQGQRKDLLLQGADLFVLPSFSENFGIAIVEAMSVGLPVLLTPGIQIASEVAASQAGLVVEDNVDALANAIAQLIKSPELRQQFGENGRQLVRQRYSWSTIAQDLASAYEAILKGKPLPKFEASSQTDTLRYTHTLG